MFEDNESVSFFGEDMTEFAPASATKKGKQAILGALASSPDNYQIIRDDLEYSGSSLTLEDVKTTAQQDRKEKLRGVVEGAILENPDPEMAESLVNALKFDELVSTPDVAMEKQALSNVRSPDSYVDVTAINEERNNKASLQLAMHKAVEESTDSALVGEFAATFFVPLSDQILATGIVPDEYETKPLDWLFASNNKVNLGEHLRKLPASEAAPIYKELERLYKKAHEDFGVTLTSAAFIGDVLDPEYDNSFMYWLETILTPFDALYAGKIITTPLKMIKGSKIVEKPQGELPVDSPAVNDSTAPDSALNQVSAVNPELGQDMLEGALDNDGSAKEIAGATSSAEVYRSKAMPSIEDGVPLEYDKAPSSVKDYVQFSNERQAEILDSSTLGGMELTEAEQAAQLAKAREDLENVNRISLRDGAVTINKEDSGYNVSAVYGKTTTKGWGDVETALDETLEATASLGVSKEDIKFLFTTKDSKLKPMTLEEASNLNVNAGGFEVHTLVTYGDYWNSAGVGKFAEDVKDLESGIIGKTKSLLGAISGYVVNPVNAYEKSIVDVANLMKDRGSFVSGALTYLAKPLTDLPAQSKRKVVELLRKSDSLGKKYSVEQLTSMVKRGELKEKEMVGVLSSYKFWDTVYLLDNRSYAKRLVADNKFIVKGTDTDNKEFSFFGNQVEDPTNLRQPILNLSTNGKLADDVDLSAYRVIKLDQAIDVDGQSLFKYAAVPSGSAYDFRRVKATDKVLEYREGYFPRRYRGEYYVDRVVRDSKGDIVNRSTFANFESSAQADKIVNKKGVQTLSDGSTVSFVARGSKELEQARDVSYFSSKNESIDMFNDIERGRSIQKHRGERLQAFRDNETLGVAPTLDPLETMLNSAYNTGRIALHMDGIAALESRWLKTFGDLLPNNKGGFPDDLTGLKGTPEEVRQATDLHNFIEKQKQVIDNYFTKRLLTNGMTRLLENLENLPGGEALANSMRNLNLDKPDPVKIVRSSAFLFYIIGNPLRQAFLQTAQLAQLMPLTLKYANPAKLMSDTLALKYGTLKAIDPKSYKEAIGVVAKRMNLSVEDTEALVKNFRQSGLPFSIDANSMVDGFKKGIGGEIYDSALKTQLSAASAGTKKWTIGLAKRAGFDWGEFNNLSGTFIVTAHRHSKKYNKPYSEFSNRDWATVATDSRRLSYNMTDVDNLDYQQGLISIPMQFAQVFHKALFTMAFGNKVLTRAERAKIVAFNASVFTGVAYSMFDEVDEYMAGAPEVVRDTVKNGMLNNAFNGALEHILKGVTGEEYDINTSYQGFSPMSGLYGLPLEYFSQGISGELLTGMKSPGIQALKSASENVQSAVLLFTGDFGMDRSTPDKIQRAALTVAGTFSGVKNTTAAYIGYAMERQAFINSKYQAILDTNTPELVAFAITGQRPEELESYNKLVSEYYSGMQFRKSEADEIGDLYYKTLKRYVGGEGTEAEYNGMQYALAAIEETDYDNKQMIVNRMLKLVNEEAKDDPARSLIYRVLTKQTQQTPEQIQAARDYVARNKGYEHIRDYFTEIYGEK